MLKMLKNTDKVFIRDLELLMSAGIYEEERQEKQRVILNIVLDVECNADRKPSTIHDVVSYEDVVNGVTEIAHGRHYDLLEELAEAIAVLCLGKELVQAVNVSIEKPDIIKAVKSVGVEINRVNA